MKFFDGRAERWKKIATRLDDEEPFSGVFDFVLPSINAADAREDIDARGEVMFDQIVRETRSQLLRIAGGEHDDLVRHFFLWESCGSLSNLFLTLSESLGGGSTARYLVYASRAPV